MKVHKFDTRVQHLKYQVLREIAREAWNDTLLENLHNIPKRILPKDHPTMRCCIYKERAILTERMQIAMGGDKNDPNVIEVIDIACDECPMSGYEITDLCRGCLAHRCEGACKKGAITFDEHMKAHIDKSKCVNCGACAKTCPYTAITNRKRPCETACKVKAIHAGEDGAAKINHEKCISCGACVYQCPFGAISDKSYILDVIDIIKKSENNTRYNVYAVVAPSIAGQFYYAKPGQILSALKELGFDTVIEAALGADIVAYAESREVSETDSFVTSSCCPAFVNYIEKQFPQLKDHVSHNLSPMAAISKCIKDLEPDCKIVFIGPCTAKKMEIQREEVRPYVDSVITFEELQALFDSRDIDAQSLEDVPLADASPFGRIFARSGGLTEAVAQGLKEHGADDFDYRPVTCDGIDACRIALLKASKGVLNGNFIEGMACEGGCVGGAGCLTHAEKNTRAVNQHAATSDKKTITESVRRMDQI
ncbi:MAG: 4Fe-4S dicluster domain-containing protein [Lachnospiraceae bacterium]|nr:4Fe-4S dicluster domain-containing protein [Lachnospiraceae bacterium]MDY4970041.1 4Fe-4S dicluster domain-containing protein [Lachnospiraceae bacterium]